MATLEAILRRVDARKPNAYEDAAKIQWIAQLDGMVAADVMLMDIVEIRQIGADYAADPQREPLVGYPHDTIYDLWLAAMIDYWNGEYAQYQNAMEMFNAHYGNFVRWFARTYAPAQGHRCRSCSDRKSVV